MKITSIETLRTEEFSNVIWVRVHTDTGMIGLGETFMAPAQSRRRSTTPLPAACSAAIRCTSRRSIATC